MHGKRQGSEFPSPGHGLSYGPIVRIALLASPLLAAEAWQPVAEELRDRGRECLVAALNGPAPTSPDEALAAYLSSLPEDDHYVLVPHSNAGNYVGALIDRREVERVIFVDATIPPLEGGPTLMAPPTFLKFLRAKADADGLLPVWTEWWDGEDLSGLFPDQETRSRIESQQRRLPLSYFERALATPAGWAQRPCAYIAFGDTYAEEVARARQAGWPVRVLPGDHLEMLVQPGAVADLIAELLTQSPS